MWFGSAILIEAILMSCASWERSPKVEVLWQERLKSLLLGQDCSRTFLEICTMLITCCLAFAGAMTIFNESRGFDLAIVTFVMKLVLFQIPDLWSQTNLDSLIALVKTLIGLTMALNMRTRRPTTVTVDLSNKRGNIHKVHNIVMDAHLGRPLAAIQQRQQ